MDGNETNYSPGFAALTYLILSPLRPSLFLKGGIIFSNECDVMCMWKFGTTSCFLPAELWVEERVSSVINYGMLSVYVLTLLGIEQKILDCMQPLFLFIIKSSLHAADLLN